MISVDIQQARTYLKQQFVGHVAPLALRSTGRFSDIKLKYLAFSQFIQRIPYAGPSVPLHGSLLGVTFYLPLWYRNISVVTYSPKAVAPGVASPYVARDSPVDHGLVVSAPLQPSNAEYARAECLRRLLYPW